MKEKEREFAIFAGERPKVLLLGNGLNRAYDGMSWDKLLDYIKDSDRYPLEARRYLMPMPLKAAMLTNNGLSEKMREIVKEGGKSGFAGCGEEITWKCFTKTNPAMREQIRNLVAGFDYVLTTNYSYEIEMALLDADELSPEQIRSMMCFHEIDSAQKKFLINTYNRAAGVPVWHIHGEARKPGSMIIGSAYYGKLLRRCVERIDGSAAKDHDRKEDRERKSSGKSVEFKRHLQERRPQKIGSWVDAFVLGNVFVLGLGMDFSESDLWWLIDYKANNPLLCGETVYLDPKSVSKEACIADSSIPCKESAVFENERQCRNYLLKTYRVITEDFGVTIRGNGDYKRFYERAVENLR